MWITYSLGERRAGDAYREKEGRGVVREERREDTMLQERGGRKGKQLRGRERLLSWRKEWEEEEKEEEEEERLLCQGNEEEDVGWRKEGK